MSAARRIVALAGGVGGAKLAEGLDRCLPAGSLTVVVNTGDDFEHLGLNICPDLDTVCYTLAGLVNPATGWGRADETSNASRSLAELGGPDWFFLGDRDLGTHLRRTQRLREGAALSQVTAEFCAAWGIHSRVLPMTDDPAPTLVHTRELGVLGFQEYFVREHCQPTVTGFDFTGVKRSHPAPGLLESLTEADGIILCPSNPWVSIGPILSVPGVRDGLAGKAVVAVSPLIRGAAIKGPAAKMYTELGYAPGALTVARHYQGLLSGFIIDTLDAELAGEVAGLGITPRVCQTIMRSAADRIELAREALSFLDELIRRPA